MAETLGPNFVRRYEPGSQARVALVNGRILDVVHGCYFAGTSVILQGGKIESVSGPAGEPTGIWPDYRIDLQGKTVLPTLYNTHCHLVASGPTMIPGLRERGYIKRHAELQRDRDMAECLAHGITHIRDAWEPDLCENRALKERISKGGISGPRILQAVAVGLPGSYLQEKACLMSKLLMPPNPDTSLDHAGCVTFPANASEQQVRDAVDIAIDERGADVIKIGDQATSLMTRRSIPTMTVDQLSAVADQAARRGVQSMMHHSSVESFRRGTQAGVSSLEHEPWDALLTQADVEAFRGTGHIIDPTISVFYGMLSWKSARDRANGHPDLDRLTVFRDKTYPFADIADEYFIPELRASVMNSYRKCAGGRPRMLGIVDMSSMFAWDTRAAIAFENIRTLYEHGVPMTTANDTIPPCTPAMMNLELHMLDHVLRGKPDGKQLSGAEAVRIATINSARSLGLDREFGSIESGKTADLIILDGDPLEDFSLIGSQVDALFMDGVLVINNCGLEVASNRTAQS